ncbi:MAG: hypothetical protein RLZZ303_2953 [Candidatus Hydrogenedentota bacterium]
MRKHTGRRMLKGAFFYSLPVAAILSVLAWDTYLNIETRRNDYEIAKLKRVANELHASLEKIRGEAASAHQLRRIEDQAAAMGMVEVAPWNVERITAPAPLRDASEFDIASALPKYLPQPQERKRETTVIAIAPTAPAPPVAIAAPETVQTEITGALPLSLAEVATVETAPEHVAQLAQPDANVVQPLAHEAEHKPVTRRVEPLIQEIEPVEEFVSLDDSVESMLATL